MWKKEKNSKSHFFVTMTKPLLLLLSILTLATCKRIAVIGGGISGTFVSKYLVDYDKNCTLEEITIFDPQPLGEQPKEISGPDWQGSRVASFRLKDSSVVEIGASVFYDGFYLIMDMVNSDNYLKVGTAFNTGESPDLDPDLRSGLGVYNGNGEWRFLVANAPKWYALLKMAWRYNLDLYRVFRAVDKVEVAFKVMNALLLSDHETTFFENAADMWDAVGLLKPAHHAFDDFLDALCVCRTSEDLPWWRRQLPYQGCIRDELLAAVALCNYNQSPSGINGLVGLGSFVAAKVKLFSIVGGNEQIIASAYRQACQNAKKRCNKDTVTHVQQRVTTVVSGLDSMELFSQDQSLGVFDVVVLAAPIHECRIEFLVQSQKDDVVLQPMPFHRVNVEDHQPEDGEPPVLAKALPEYATRPYTQVVTTIVSGAVLNASYFSLSDSDVPRSIYMTERGKELEENITAISQITTKSSAYKVFSNDVLSDVALKNIFGEKYTVEVVKVWGGPYGGATPDYQGSGRTINYQLYDGSGGNSHGSAVLYYSNAIEGSMACIELSAIGAKSVAKLVAKRLGLVVPHNGTGIHSDEL